MRTEPQRKAQKHPLCYDPRCGIHTTRKTNVALRATTWRLSKNGVLIGEFGSEEDAIEIREALCGINQRDDFLIVSMGQIG